TPPAGPQGRRPHHRPARGLTQGFGAVRCATPPTLAPPPPPHYPATGTHATLTETPPCPAPIASGPPPRARTPSASTAPTCAPASPPRSTWAATRGPGTCAPTPSAAPSRRTFPPRARCSRPTTTGS